MQFLVARPVGLPQLKQMGAQVCARLLGVAVPSDGRQGCQVQRGGAGGAATATAGTAAACGLGVVPGRRRLRCLGGSIVLGLLHWWRLLMLRLRACSCCCCCCRCLAGGLALVAGSCDDRNWPVRVSHTTAPLPVSAWKHCLHQSAHSPGSRSPALALPPPLIAAVAAGALLLLLVRGPPRRSAIATCIRPHACNQPCVNVEMTVVRGACMLSHICPGSHI